MKNEREKEAAVEQITENVHICCQDRGCGEPDCEAVVTSAIAEAYDAGWQARAELVRQSGWMKIEAENEILKTARTVVGQNWTLTLSGGTAGNMQKYFQGESPDPPKWYYIYHKDKFESSGIIGPFNSASEAYTAFKKEAGEENER